MEAHMKRLVSLVLVAVFAVAVVIAQESGYSGQWMVDRAGDPGKLQLTFR
jgi:hypothetical protein